jgi:RNA polymerase sigma-70 factor (ECF subfamily)
MEIKSAFNSYYKPLCLYAMHYLSGDADEAEDIVQECFIKLWKSRAENPKPFLYSAVRNACVDYLRRSKNISAEIHPEDLAGIITDEAAAERSFDEAELWTAVDSLPERCREIFLMSKLKGMKYREIAEELGLSEKTVEHQISKALRVLKGKKGGILFVFACFA